MPNLTELLSNPTKTRLAVAKFLYQAGTNVALYNATRSPKYLKFRDKLETVLQKQIAVFTDENIINEAGFDTTPTKDIVSKYFINLTDLYPKEELDSVYLWAGTQGGQAALDKLGIGKLRKAIEASFVLRNQKLITFLTKFQNLMVTSVDDTTKEWISQVITEGKSEFFTNDEIARLLIEGGQDIAKFRAKLIAETEVAHAMSFVERQTYILNNVNTMMWKTSEDSDVDPICEGNSDAQISVFGTFPSGDSEPPAHPRCRCYLEPIFDNDFLSRQGDFFSGQDWERESRNRRHRE